MSRAKTWKVVAIALAAALPACRSGRGPSAGRVEAPVNPARVQQLVGQTRILRHRGHEKKVTLKREDLARLGGGCDAAVDVRQAALEGGTLRLSLTHLGRPNVVSLRRTERRRLCEPAVQTALVVSRVTSAEALDATLNALLPTPEQYLRTWGTPFDRQAGPAPSVGAADGLGTTGEERVLAHQVTTWPVALLTVDADVPAGRRVGGRESEVDFVAVVGADGRLHAPRLITSLSEEHAKHVLRALSLWRYQPARSTTAEIPARVTGKAVLRLF
jgi:hypothetical protein